MSINQHNGISQQEADRLVELNVDIGRAECEADRNFFEALLHERFTMRRPTGRVDDRQLLLDGLSAGDQRRTDAIEVVLRTPCRAVVTCHVVKWTSATPDADPPADAPVFDNLRVFLRDTPDAPWQMLCWLNEPLGPSFAV